jgi:hypothetical protein
MTISHKENFRICNGCGEIFDANIEVEATYHDRAEHVPLLPYRPWRRPAHAVMLARAC